MATIEALYNEPSWLRITPVALTSGSLTELASFGTKIDFDKAKKVTPTHVGAAAATATETAYAETEGANGNKYSVVDNGRNFNVITGAEISDDTNSSTTASSECEVFWTPTQRVSIIDIFANGTPVIGTREIGKNSTTQLPAGYEHILGNISELKENPVAGPHTCTFNIVGKDSYTAGAGVTYTTFNTAITGSSNTITPHNDGTARTIPAITSGDLVKLLQGKIVYTAAS
jgi:hypothetical protein